MTTPILPAALKSFRDRKHWTQQQLADSTKCENPVSLPTIKRIESTKGGPYMANVRVAKGLAKALGVSVDDLSRPPADKAASEASLQKHGYKPVRAMVDAETWLAFRMVEDIYGIPTRSQIIMAPLFAALLAKASLAWRRDEVAEIFDATSRLTAPRHGHLSFVDLAYRIEEGARREELSIEEGDLFGKDPSKNNRFADFLAHFAEQLGAETIEIERDSRWKTAEGMPAYRIGAELIREIAGDDLDARYAISQGHVRLKDIPEDLRRDGKMGDRIAWIIARIPEEERGIRTPLQEAMLSVLRKIDLDLANFPKSPNDAKEVGDA